jgi:tRNA dimethylallyltransferase
LSGDERLLLVLAGPTASGKTALALALAARFPLRLISMDSQQVYRGMDIGTAKPPAPERASFALMDVVDPGEGYSAGRFCREAGAACEEAWRRGLIPALVGGTGLYYRSLVEGLAEIPPIPEALRLSIESMDALERLAQLEELDPEGAAGIDRRNPRRVARALEVRIHTGKGIKTWHEEGKAGALKPGRMLGWWLHPPAGTLAGRIRHRVGESLEAGWMKEALDLKGRWGEETVRKTGAIGYAELFDLDAGLSTPAEARTRIENQTLAYARRQRTWFRSEKTLVPLETWTPDFLAAEIEAQRGR